MLVASIVTSKQNRSEFETRENDSVKVDIATTPDVFDVLADEWNALLKRSVTDTPFSTLEWHRNWWAAYHPGDLWVVTVRDDDGVLQGIMSAFIVEADGMRALHFVGCEDVTDYLDVLVDRDHQESVYVTIANALIANSASFDVIDLCNIPAESPTLAYFVEVLGNCGFSVETSVQEVCPVINLPENFPQYVKSIDKKQSKELVRKLRIAQAQGSSVSWYTVDESHDLDEEIDKFLTLMAASHPEKAEFLQDEQHVAFFKSLVPDAFKAGWLQLNFLVITGEPVATYLNFDYNNRILVYNSGLNPDKGAQLSPGIVLLGYNIQQAIEQGRDVFNFLRGNESYKYKMGGKDTQIYNLKATYSQ